MKRNELTDLRKSLIHAVNSTISQNLEPLMVLDYVRHQRLEEIYKEIANGKYPKVAIIADDGVPFSRGISAQVCAAMSAQNVHMGVRRMPVRWASQITSYNEKFIYLKYVWPFHGTPMPQENKARIMGFTSNVVMETNTYHEEDDWLSIALHNREINGDGIAVANIVVGYPNGTKERIKAECIVASNKSTDGLFVTHIGHYVDKVGMSIVRMLMVREDFATIVERLYQLRSISKLVSNCGALVPARHNFRNLKITCVNGILTVSIKECPASDIIGNIPEVVLSADIDSVIKAINITKAPAKDYVNRYYFDASVDDSQCYIDEVPDGYKELAALSTGQPIIEVTLCDDAKKPRAMTIVTKMFLSARARVGGRVDRLDVSGQTTDLDGLNFYNGTKTRFVIAEDADIVINKIEQIASFVGNLAYNVTFAANGKTFTVPVSMRHSKFTMELPYASMVASENDIRTSILEIMRLSSKSSDNCMRLFSDGKDLRWYGGWCNIIKYEVDGNPDFDFRDMLTEIANQIEADELLMTAGLMRIDYTPKPHNHRV